jgi:hypothetical protein
VSDLGKLLEVTEGDPPEIRDLQRQIKVLERQNEKLRSGEKIIRDTVGQIFETMPPVKCPAKPRLIRAKRSAETAVAHISDVHIGKVTPSYNIDVARDRMMLYGQKIVEITEMRRSFADIPDLHIYLGGDLVEGEDIFPHQAHLIDVNLLDQAVRRGPLIFVDLILSMLQHFERVKVISVPGNHGRNTKRNHPRTNWDTVCGEMVRVALLGTDAHPRKEFENRLDVIVTEDFYYVDRLPGGWGNLIVHGDQISGTGGYGGFPFYGAGTAAWGWIDTLDETWHYMFFAHFHTMGSLSRSKKRQWLANGTPESDNEWAKEKLKSSQSAVQRLCFFNEKHGLISDDPVYLDERGP